MRAILVPAVMTGLSFCGYHAYSTHTHHNAPQSARYDGRDARDGRDGRDARGHYSPRFQQECRPSQSWRTAERPDCGRERQCHYHDRGELTPRRDHRGPEASQQNPEPGR
jgi:hypothetical protein